MILQKPKLDDISLIETILSQWTDNEEVSKYLERIKNEISGIIEYNTHFWTIKFENDTIGILGISNLLPKTKPFITGKNPIELKIMYLNNSFRGYGLGKTAIKELETLVKSLSYDEILIRSAKRYKNTAWAFYQKMGYLQIGTVDDDMAVFRKTLK